MINLDDVDLSSMTFNQFKSIPTIDRLLLCKKETIHEDEFLNKHKEYLENGILIKFIEKFIDLSKILEYSENSPSRLIWKLNFSSDANIGEPAGYAAGYGKIGRKRYYVGLFTKRLMAHRIVYLLHNHTIIDNFVIDHIDGNPLNNDIDNLRCISKKHNNRSMALRKNNSTGKTGVGRYSDVRGDYYSAFWKVMDGKNKFKTFSINKYGEDLAFKLACEARDSAMEELLNNGEWYGERHGKELNLD